jgi:hypothetical protein
MEVTACLELTINERKAFTMLCDALDIKELIQSDKDLVIKDGYVQVRTPSGGYLVVDNRADLFAALRNVANCITPNCEFRSDPYITHYDECDEVEHNYDVCDICDLLERVKELEARAKSLEKRMDTTEKEYGGNVT